MLNFKLCFFLNSLSAIVIIIWGFLAPDNGLGSTKSNVSFAWAVILNLGIFVIAMRIIEQIVVEAIQHEIAVISSKDEQSALHSLLNLMCEAVVEVDTTLT